jgi:adenylylsulfate kinase-like enzyme
LGFSADDRSENLRRIGGIARILNDNGIIAICAVLAPLASVRQRVKSLLGEERYLEIYLSAPIEVCKSRDQAGIYRLAEAGKIKAFPGVSSPYEPPESPDLMLPTHEISVAESVRRIIELLKARGWVA